MIGGGLQLRTKNKSKRPLTFIAGACYNETVKIIDGHKTKDIIIYYRFVGAVNQIVF